MKTHRSLCSLYCTLAAFGSLVCLMVWPTATTASPLTFDVLHSFEASRLTDGASPYTGLVLAADGNLYGTTTSGGSGSWGTVFKITAAGDFTNLYSFTNGSDGASPKAPLIQGSDGSLYGTAESGGANYGTVFKITTEGRLTSLYSFTNGSDGAHPEAALVQGLDGTLYGTAETGGSGNAGTVFKISTSGSFSPLYSFTNGNANPYAPLVFGPDGNLYGTTTGGGSNNDGSVFQISTGGAYSNLYSFTNGDDGIAPYAGLALGGDGNLYGMTSAGGTGNFGTVFSITTAGTFANLYSFTGGADGQGPTSSLVLGSGGFFRGTAQGNSTTTFGSVFEVTTGGALTPLYGFTNGADGNTPNGLVLGPDGTIYGTATAGGVGSEGTVFSLGSGTSGGKVTISVSASPAADGAVSGGGTVISGAAVTVKATPKPGFTFVNWTVSGTPVSSAATYEFPAKSSETLVANFAPAGASYPVSVSTNGDGSVTLSGDEIKAGGSVTLKAVPAPGYLFAGWSGITNTTKNPLTLAKVESSITLQASFVPNPFPAYAGVYAGLFTPTNGPIGVTNSGLLRGLTVRTNGNYSGTLLIEGAAHPFSGVFGLNLQAGNVIAKSGGEPALTVVLNLVSNTGSPQITGTVSGSNGISATLLANLAAKTSSGAYTLLVSPPTNQSAAPGGSGYAIITNSAGVAKITGALADGTSFAQTTAVSANGSVPLYSSLYGGKGLVLGWINLTNGLGGPLTWVHPASAAGLFKAAFASENTATLSPWIDPPSGAALPTNLTILDFSNGAPFATNNYALTITNATLRFAGGTNGTTLAGTISAKTGLVTVTIEAGKTRTSGYGVILANGTNGGGYFVGKTNSGALILTP